MLGQTKQTLAQKESELRAAVAQRDLMRTQLAEREARLRELESAGKGQHELLARIAELEKQVAESADLREHANELTQKARDASNLRERVSELEQRLREADALRARVAELEQQTREFDGMRERLSELQDEATELTALRARVAELEQSGRGASPLEAERNESDKDRRIAELEAALARQSVRAAAAPEVDYGWEPTPTPAEDDDLLEIKGIGRATERSLRKLGVRTYAQIAAWGSEDVARFAETLKTQRAKVEAWVRRAAELLKKSE